LSGIHYTTTKITIILVLLLLLAPLAIAKGNLLSSDSKTLLNKSSAQVTERARLKNPASLKTMIEESPLIAEVKVVKLQSHMGEMGTARNRAIYTEVEFKVLTVLKDENDDAKSGKVKMSFFGGTVGDTTMVVNSSPVFKSGQNLILFANPALKATPTFAGTRGVWKIENNVLMNYAGSPVLAISANGISVQTQKRALAPSPVPLDQHSRVVVRSSSKKAESALTRKDAILTLAKIIEEVSK